MKKYSINGIELSDWTCKFLSVCEEIMRADEMVSINNSRELLKSAKPELVAMLKDSIAMQEESLKRDLEESEIIEILDYAIGFAPFEGEEKDYAEQTLLYLGYLSGDSDEDEESEDL